MVLVRPASVLVTRCLVCTIARPREEFMKSMPPLRSDYGFLSDCHSVALVSTTGSIDG